MPDNGREGWPLVAGNCQAEPQIQASKLPPITGS